MTPTAIIEQPRVKPVDNPLGLPAGMTADQLLAQVNEELQRRYLRHFIEGMWHVVEPTTDFVGGWHIDAICDHLEAVKQGIKRQDAPGAIRRLIINIPPRCMKSLSVSVGFPAWIWVDMPSFRSLFTSYSQDLSTRDSVKTRAVITSPWYQRNWGNRFKLSGDVNLKTRFENDKTGFRLATSVGGVATGEGADGIFCLPYDARIETSAGPKLVGDLVQNKEQVEVLSFNHDSNCTEYRKIELWQENPASELIEIELEDGHVFCCTEEHPVFTRNRGYVRADQLTEDDECVVSE